MNLFTYKDDFLADEDFTALNSLATRRFPMIKNEDDYYKQHPEHPIRSRERQFLPGHTTLPEDVAVRYGKSGITAVDKIRTYLMNECSIINPEIVNIWFSYMTPDQIMPWHCDGPVREFPVERCITTCLYVHDAWLEEWGGNIMAESGDTYLPAPNRLIVWSRDVIHKVSPIFNDAAPIRMLLGTTWTTEGRKNDF